MTRFIARTSRRPFCLYQGQLLWLIGWGSWWALCAVPSKRLGSLAEAWNSSAAMRCLCYRRASAPHPLRNTLGQSVQDAQSGYLVMNMIHPTMLARFVLVIMVLWVAYRRTMISKIQTCVRRMKPCLRQGFWRVEGRETRLPNFS